MSFLKQRLYVISIGMAMFTMFFGAGNVVFPLLVGQTTQDKSLFALLGLIITAVGVPFTGLFGMTLFDGDYRQFFYRLGKIPGFIIIFLIMGLIGPFGAMPRCIALSYSTTKMFFPGTSLELFCFVSAVIIFLMTVRKNKIADLLGWILTPFLILTLAIIIVKGIFVHPELLINTKYSAVDAFMHGLNSGYQTMDLLGAFFFCSVVIASLKEVSKKDGVFDKREFLINSVFASSIGAFLLAIVYIGMSVVAALHADSLTDIPADVLLGTIAMEVLGPYAGVVTCLAVILACFTTAVALASVFSEFLSRDVCQNKIGYTTALVITTIITYFFSTLEFKGIFRMLAPIVQLIYPSLLVMSLINISYKLWGVKTIKTPVALAFIISFIMTVL